MLVLADPSNTDEFEERNFKKAGYAADPLEDGSLDSYRVFRVPLATLTRRALEGSGLDAKSQERSRTSSPSAWPTGSSRAPSRGRCSGSRPSSPPSPSAAANVKVLKAGWNFCDITDAFQTRYEVVPAKLAPGVYRNVTGNTALALGFVAASRRSGLPLFQGAYPITPASDLLHELAQFKHFGITTFQAEDEIARVLLSHGDRLARPAALRGP